MTPTCDEPRHGVGGEQIIAPGTASQNHIETGSLQRFENGQNDSHVAEPIGQAGKQTTCGRRACHNLRLDTLVTLPPVLTAMTTSLTALVTASGASIWMK